MPQVIVNLTEEEFAAFTQLAQDERRSVEDQVAFYAARSLNRTRQNRKAAAKSWESRRASDASASHMRCTGDADALGSDAVAPSPPSPPSPLPPFSSPTPPSNPPVPTPTPAPTHAHERDGEPLPFSEPLEPPPDDLPDVDLGAETIGKAQGDQPVGQEQGAPRRAQAVPKPKRGVYSPAFEAWWKLRAWGGSKKDAYQEWRGAGLERDDELREKVVAATAAQIEHKAKQQAAGVFVPQWKDAERWLKDERWDDNLEPIEAAPAVAPFRRGAPTPARRVPAPDPKNKYAW